MLEGMCITARQTLMLFLLMAFGIGARKARILDEQSIRKLTDFVLVIVTPCLIITSFQRPFEVSVLRGAAWAFAAAAFTHATGMALSRFFIRDADTVRRRALRFAVPPQHHRHRRRAVGRARPADRSCT